MSKYMVSVGLGFVVVKGEEYVVGKPPQSPALMTRSEAMTAALQILSRRDETGWGSRIDGGAYTLQFSVMEFKGANPCPGCISGRIVQESKYMALCDVCGDYARNVHRCPVCEIELAHGEAARIVRTAGKCPSCRKAD